MRLEGHGRVSHVDIWGKSIQVGGAAKAKALRLKYV